jgi:threonine/homoserine/homoserine lactone efflux protein
VVPLKQSRPVLSSPGADASQAARHAIQSRVLEYLLLGGGFALAAAAQPGPLQAFLLSQVAEKGWRHTLPAALAPLLSDGPIAILAVFVLGRLPQTLTRALEAAGGLLLLYLAWSAFREWRREAVAGAAEGSSAPRTLLQAAAVNILNPNPYLAWTLVLGPALVAAWREQPAHAIGLVVSFYATMVVALAATIVLFGTTGLLGPRGRRRLVLVSAITLAALGVYRLAAGLASPGTGPQLGT